MGKKTLYHPVSLHVLRGAAEYCGYQFGRMTQVKSDPTGLSATYKVSVDKLPARTKDRSLSFIWGDLQACFNAEIKVIEMEENTNRGVFALIRASIVRDPEQYPLPEPSPEIAPIQP